MATRSVGRIEVTVEADTGRLQAQIVSGATKGARKAKTAAEKELSRIEGEVKLRDEQATKEARLTKLQLEAIFRGIEVSPNLDLSEMRQDLIRAREEAEALDLILDARVELSDRDLALITADWEGFKARTEADAIQAKIDADSAQAIAEMNAFREEEEAKELELKASLREALFDAAADAEAFRLEQERDEIEFTASLETALMEAQAEAAIRRIEDEQADIDLEIRTAKAAAEMAAWRRTHEEPLDLPIDPNLARATTAFDAWLLRQESKGIDVDVDPDTVKATIEFEAWIARMQGKDIDVGVNLSGIGGGGGAGGGGGGFGGLSSWFFDQQKLIAGAIGLLGNDIAVALEGALAAGIAVASSAFSALGGAIGGIMPLLAGLVPAAGAVVVGFQGMGDALGSVTKEFADATKEGRDFNINAEKIQQSLAGLTPNARDFVTTFAEIFPQLQKIQSAVQGKLFAGLDSDLRALSTSTIPDVGKALKIAAGEVNDFIRQLAASTQGIDFSGLMKDLKPAIGAVEDALTALFRSFEPLLRAATPAAQELAEAFRSGAQELERMIDQGAESGALTQFFQEGVDSLKVWWELIRNTGDALFTLFQAGKESGDGFVQSLADIIERFDNWMESAAGQTALQEFFATGERTMKAMIPILKGLQGLFRELVDPEAVSRLESLTDALGRALPFLGQILDVVGRVGVVSTLVEAFARIGEALQPAIPALDRLADALGDILVGAIDSLTPLVEGLGPILGQVADALTPLAPAIIKVADAYVSMLTPEVLDFLQHFADALTDLSPLLVELLDVAIPFVEVALTPMITALELASPLLDLLGEGFRILTPLVEALETPLRIVADILLILESPLKLLSGTLEEVGLSWSDMANPAQAAGKVLHGVFTEDLHGTSVIADEARKKNEALAKQYEDYVVALVKGAAALDQANRKELAAGENLAGFENNAQLAAEAQEYFNRAAIDMEGISIEPLDDMIDALEKTAIAADDAAEKSDALKDAWDRLFGGAMELSEANDAFAETLNKIGDVQEERAKRLTAVADAQDDYNKAVRDAADAQAELDANTDPEKTQQLTNALKDANATVGDTKAKLDEAKNAYNENLTAIKGNTDAAIENRKTVREGIDEALAIAAAKVREGASWEEARKSVLKNKEALVEQLVQQGFNEDAVRSYIDTMNLTPKNIRTAIELANREQANADLDGIKKKLEDMDGSSASLLTKAEGVLAVQAGLDGIMGTADDINRTKAKLAVESEGVPQTNSELQSTIDKANELDGKSAVVKVSVIGGEESFRLPSGVVVRQHGGQVGRYGAIGGEAGAELFRHGTLRGLVSRPTLLPPGTMVTSAALTAALLRNQHSVGKQVYNTINVTPTMADPEAVATSVLNRAAVLAR